MVSILAIGPKVRRFKPGRGDGFSWAIIIRSTPSFKWEVKQEAPCRKILRYIKEIYEYERNISLIKSIISFAQFLPICN
jgi:hypothetical protein